MNNYLQHFHELNPELLHPYFGPLFDIPHGKDCHRTKIEKAIEHPNDSIDGTIRDNAIRDKFK